MLLVARVFFIVGAGEGRVTALVIKIFLIYKGLIDFTTYKDYDSQRVSNGFKSKYMERRNDSYQGRYCREGIHRSCKHD